MPAKAAIIPRWKILGAIGLLGLGAFALPPAKAQQVPAASPSSTAPAYGGAATEGGPGSTNAATGRRVEPPQTPSGAHSPPQQAQGLGQNQPGISNADRNLMRALAQVHLAEVDMGMMAQSRSQHVLVRSFAQRMMDDHGKALEELQKMADAKGVILPGGTDKKHAAAKEKLTALTGDEFTQEYLTHAGDMAHREAHQMLQRAAQSAQDPDLKAHVGHSLALVEQHLQMANHLMAKLNTGGRGTQMGQVPSQTGGQMGTQSGRASQADRQKSAAPAAPAPTAPTAPGSAPR